MRIMPETSQIATILTLVMAVIFLFIAITINIGNIAQEKTMLSNVSDNAALLLASMLGSLSNGLRMKLGLTCKDGHCPGEDCDIDLLLLNIIIAAAALIASIIFAIVTFGGGTPVTLGAVLYFVALIGGSAALFAGGVATAVTEPGSFKQAQLQFQNMTFEERLKEQGIQLSLYSLVNDPNKICDNGTPNDPADDKPGAPNEIDRVTKKNNGDCIDFYDLDMDGRKTGDCVSPFALWYTERLKSLPRKGDVVQAIFDALFSPGLKKDEKEVKSPRIYVLKDEETWKAKARATPVEGSYGFWINTNIEPDNEKKPDADAKGYLSMGYTDDPHNIAGVVYEHDIYFVEWLLKRFTPLAKRLYDYGYGLSAIWGEKKKEKGTKFDIDFLADEILEFEDGAAELYGTDFDSKLQSFEEWMPVFYNGTSDKDHQDWSYRMQEWINVIQRWITVLGDRKDAITGCADSCAKRGPYKCGGEAGGEVCEQIFVPKTCTRHIDQTCTDPDTGESYDCGYDEDYDCSYCDPPTKWCNCDNGEYLNGGRLCPSGYCIPTANCTSPITGESKNCCNIADNGLYYQLCDATLDSSGGNDAKCGASTCRDTYYKCDYDPNNNVITREHAIEYLTQFRDDVQALMAAFKKGYEDALLKESDPRLYDALYEWEDYAGRRGEVTSQRVKHAVYVRLSDDLKPNDKDPKKGFQLPYPHQYREWGWPSFGNRKCTEVAREKGEFGIVVARYDQDVGTAETAPLRKLWVFKTRQKTSETEPAFPLSYTDPSKEVTKEASKFVLENGIVSATKAYYGPGYTFKKEVIKERDPNIFKASKINKDIKIERAKWTDFIKD